MKKDLLVIFLGMLCSLSMKANEPKEWYQRITVHCAQGDINSLNSILAKNAHCLDLNNMLITAVSNDQVKVAALLLHYGADPFKRIEHLDKSACTLAIENEQDKQGPMVALFLRMKKPKLARCFSA